MIPWAAEPAHYTTIADDPRALSVRQPWTHLIVHADKPLENRVKWTERYPGTRFRGECFLHASAGMTDAEWCDVVEYLVDRCDVDPRFSEIRMPLTAELKRGGIIGRCRVIGYVRPNDGTVVIDARTPGVKEPVRDLTPWERAWWMGGFALVLADVQPLSFTPMKGALGFFRVPQSIARLAIES